MIAALGALMAMSAPKAGATPPDVQWHQLTTPALGGRLRTLAIHPNDPNQVFAGTAEGTVILSHDGGQTWQERPLAPFVQRRSDNKVSRLPTVRGTVIEDARQNPVRRIAICPGQQYEVLVASASGLYGSDDGGITYARLFGVFRRENIRVVDCRPQCPGVVALATDQGLFVSEDGGLSFEGGRSPIGKAVETVEVDCRDGQRHIYFSESRRLYRSNLDDDPYDILYPGPPADGELAVPFGQIRDVELVGDRIWLATDRGVQRSDDRGVSWLALPNDLGRSVRQVWVRPEHPPQVAAVLDLRAEGQSSSLNAIAIVSNDDGRDWSPLFAGLSQRRVRWVVNSTPSTGGGAWWLVTSGGIWTEARNATPGPATLALWARLRIATSPDLEDIIAEALKRARLSGPTLASLGPSVQTRCALPQVTLTYRRAPLNRTSDFQQMGLPFAIGSTTGSEVQQIWMAFGAWNLGCIVGDAVTVARPRAELVSLRNDVVFALQDAWHDRMRMLHQLSRGDAGLAGSWAAWARIRSMEAVMASFAGPRIGRALRPEPKRQGDSKHL